MSSPKNSFLKYAQEEMKKDPELAVIVQAEFDKRQLARDLRNLRESVKVSQQELAELVGTGQPSIARLESGRTTPKLDVVARIAHALGYELGITFTKVMAAKKETVGRAPKPRPKKPRPTRAVSKARARAAA